MRFKVSPLFVARIRFRLHLPDAAVKCLLQCDEVAEDVGFGNDRWDHLQLLEKIEVGHGNAHHQHAHAGRIQSRQRIFQCIDACLVHVGDAVHPENQEPALGCCLTGDVEELAGETEEERPIDVLDEELVADRVRDGQFICPRFIGDRRERRLPFRDVAYLLHEDERCHDEAGSHRDDQIGEHGQHEHEEHQERIRPRHLKEMANAAVVDDANPDGNEQTCKDCVGNMLDEARQAEQRPTGRSSRAAKNRPWPPPDRGLPPPASTLTTVRIVAPAPGMPPIRPAAMLPRPWPTSSRLLLCCVRVRLSATSDVSSESTAPSNESWSAAAATTDSCCRSNDGITRLGSPDGMAPITGTSSRSNADSTVSDTSATSDAGTARVKRGTMKT